MNCFFVNYFLRTNHMSDELQKKESQPFGYFLGVDLYDCKEGACDDVTLCYDFLEKIVDELKMKKQSPPYVFRSDAVEYPDKAGISGWVPLIESGIQIHTLSVKNFISIDIYSCRKFDISEVKKFVASYFFPSKIEEHFIERGIEYNS